MTANGTTNDQEQGKGKPSGFSLEVTKSVTKRRAKRKKRQSFKDACDRAYSSAEAQQEKRHYSLTSNQAFNDLLESFGHNYFEIIELRPGETWKTRLDITPPRNLLELYEKDGIIVGMRFNTLTKILAIDLDIRSPYHPSNNEAEYRRLLAVLESIGLVGLEVVRSSDSQGLHLYFALPEALPSWQCAHGLEVVLRQAGFTVSKGVLEIFPNRKQYNPKEPTSFNGLRLPLQRHSGSVVLDPIDLNPVHADLNHFIHCLKHHAQRQDMDSFKRFLKVAYEDFEINAKGRVKSIVTSQYQGRAKQWHEDLVTRILMGFTGDAQTNDLVLEVMKVVYIFRHKDGQAAVTEGATWIKSLPGYERYCGHQHEIEKRCWEWLKCVQKLYYPYGSKPQERAGLDYGEEIKQTVERLKVDGRSQNQANATRQQAARQRLAATIRTLRDRIRQGLAAPATITGWIQLMIATAKELFEQGFSVQFLYQFKRLLGRLIAFAVRVTRRAGGTGESASVDPTGTEAPPEPVAPPTGVVPVADVTPPSVASCITENTHTTEEEKTLKPASEAALLATSASESPSENAETRATPAITGNFAIYEGQEASVVSGRWFPYTVGQRVRFQHETFEGWRKGTIVQINWESGYFVNCLIKINVFMKRSRYAPGQWVERVVKLFNQTWIKPYPEPT